MERDNPVIRYTQPEKYDVDELVTIGGCAFLFRVSLTKCGVIRSEFNPDTSSLSARIGKKQRAGRPTIRRKD